MNNFWSLVGYEYKKIFGRRAVVITLALAWLLALYFCLVMVLGGNTQGNYYDGDLSAYASMQRDKGFEKQWEGRPLDGELILEASRAYQKIDKNVTNYTRSESYQKYARPYSSIYTLVDAAYAQSGQAFNVDDFQNLSPEDAHNYYAIRESQYCINLTNNALWSAADVEKVMSLDKDVEKPFIMAYKDGYQRFFALSTTTVVLLLFTLSLCLSPLFSDEYARRTDSLLLTAKNGKGSLLFAKLFAASTLTVGLTILFLLSTYLACMAVYGFDGTFAPIQLLIPAVTYPFTMLEGVAMLAATTLCGALLHAAICCLLSALSKNAVIPMFLSAALVLAGMFGGGSNPVIARLWNLLPSAMGSFWNVTTQLVYTVFGCQLMLYQAVCLFSVPLAVLLLWLALGRFRRHQVA